MYLKSLELSGFKSFAKKSDFEFKTPITAIVGPNGSGKSNIAEAFRFVLGEQSMKSLRTRRGEDLIFNGSPDVSRSNRARVRLVLDNSRRIFDVDFDEVAIERVVYRDSENEYYLNGSKVRLKDILETLAAAHIGASSHHIISQGEADKVLDANPRERKSMIEDALGLKIYHYKRRESERKLKKTLNNISSVELQRKEIAPNLKFLHKQVQKIEETDKLREELDTLYLEYLKREDLRITDARNDVSGRRAPVAERLSTVQTQLDEARGFLEKARGGSELNQELSNLESELSEVRTKKDELARESGRIEGEASSYERFINRERERSASSEHRVVEFGKVSEFNDTLRSMISEASGSDDPQHIRNILNEMHRKIDEFASEHGHTPNAVATEEAERELERLRAELQSAEENTRRLEDRENALRAKYEEIRSHRENEQSEAQNIERRVFELLSEQNDLRSKITAFDMENQNIDRDAKQFDDELRSAAEILGQSARNYRDFVLDGVDEDVGHQAQRKHRIEKIKIRLEDAGSHESRQATLREYRELSEHDSFLDRELNDLRSAEASLQNLIVDLNQRLDVEFKNGLQKINAQFQEYFTLIFGGGTADVKVVRDEKKREVSMDPSADSEVAVEDGEGDGEENTEAEEGLELNVTLPRKKIRGLEMLSGGERALTSIALVFAVSHVNPPPFIILDETDAALDEANSRVYGDMIGRLSESAQLIVITHNRETMSRAGALYGVSMGGDGVSRLLSVHMDR